MKAIFSSLLVAGSLAAAGVHAHHSFSATYLENEEVTIEGEIAAFMFRNPHAFVHVLAPDGDGKEQRWAVEWGGASALSGQVTRDTLRPGDQVVVTGNPGRNAADFRLRLRSIRRPADGWQWSGDFD